VADPSTPRFWPSEWERVGRAKGDTRTRGYVFRGDGPYTFIDVRGRKTTVEPGGRISERQYANFRYQGGGWSSKSEWETFQKVRSSNHPSRAAKRLGLKHQSGAWKKWAKRWSEEYDIPLRQVEAPDSQYNMKFTAAQKSDWDNSPDGAFAQLLVALGFRKESDDWQVGDTHATTR
jgi:hypothetical protein